MVCVSAFVLVTSCQSWCFENIIWYNFELLSWNYMNIILQFVLNIKCYGDVIYSLLKPAEFRLSQLSFDWKFLGLPRNGLFLNGLLNNKFLILSHTTDCSVERKILVRKKRNHLCSYSGSISGYKDGNLKQKKYEAIYTKSLFGRKCTGF